MYILYFSCKPHYINWKTQSEQVMKLECACVFQERSPTSARGRAVPGNSLVLTNSPATTGNTRGKSRSSAIYANARSPDPTTYPCT